MTNESRSRKYTVTEFDRMVDIYEAALFLLDLETDAKKRAILNSIIRQTGIQEVEITTEPSETRANPNAN